MVADLELYQTTEPFAFIDGIKTVRVRVNGVTDDESIVVRCRLTGSAADRVCLNNVREVATVIYPRWQNGVLIASVVIKPARSGDIAACFSIKGDDTAAPLRFDMVVRPEIISVRRGGLSSNGRHLH